MVDVPNTYIQWSFRLNCDALLPAAPFTLVPADSERFDTQLTPGSPDKYGVTLPRVLLIEHINPRSTPIRMDMVMNYSLVPMATEHLDRSESSHDLAQKIPGLFRLRCKLSRQDEPTYDRHPRRGV